MAKKVKIEKETRKLIEAVSDLVKKKGDRYKFKSKNKKLVKKVKRTCVHWIIRKGKESPTLIQDPVRPGYWRCTICGASFPIMPKEKDEDYERITNEMLEVVNQIQFWSVKCGGDADDTKMFIKLKENLPRFNKVSRQVLKAVKRRDSWEKNKKAGNAMSQFNAYAGFNYKA